MKSDPMVRRMPAWMPVVLLGLTIFAVAHAASEPRPAEKLSGVAPSADLLKQVDQHIASIREGIADEQSYADKSRQINKEAHTLAVLALALALHDEDHRLKPSAAALSNASRQLAASKDYASAKAAVDAIVAANEGRGDAAASPSKWEKIASMEQLMKQVTFVNNRLRRNMRRFADRADDNARDAAVLAVIAQAVAYDTHEVKNDGDIDKWYEYCDQMRDAAGELNAKIHAKDQPAAEAALGKLTKSCESCHETFRVMASP